MKKKLVFVTMLLGLFVACSNDKKENNLDNNQKVVESVEKKVEEKKNIAEVEDFSEFQKEILDKNADLKLSDFEVLKYAKGVEFLITTTNKDFSKDDFEKLTTSAMQSLKEKYILDEGLEIKSSISYQKDAKTDAVFLYEYKAK